MEQIMNYVKPELLIAAAVLYFVGSALKSAQAIPDKYIPIILGAIGIALCGLWVAATSAITDVQSVMLAIFASITQGILVAGLSTYINQIIKQVNKTE